MRVLPPSGFSSRITLIAWLKYARYDKFPSKSLSATTDLRSGHYDTSVYFMSIENLCKSCLIYVENWVNMEAMSSIEIIWALGFAVREVKQHVTSNGKCEFVPFDQILAVFR